jgi:hypothetical protein
LVRSHEATYDEQKLSQLDGFRTTEWRSASEAALHCALELVVFALVVVLLPVIQIVL